MEFPELLQKAREGTLSPVELWRVAAFVERASVESVDLYTAMLILGVSMATQHASLLERFLDEGVPAFERKLAIHILVTQWDMGRDHIGLLSSKALEASQNPDDCDDECDVYIAVATGLGVLMKEHPDAATPELRCLLARVAEGSGSDVVRAAAVRAMIHARGGNLPLHILEITVGELRDVYGGLLADFTP